MSTVANIITDVRYEINDPSSTRITTDTPILAGVKRAVTRANRICQRESIQFAKKKATLTTVANQAYVSLPADFDVDIGLWRDGTHLKVNKCTEAAFEQIISASALANWYLDLENSRVLFNGTPTGVETLTLYYFPKIDVSAYTTSTTMPWAGRLDDIIVEYVSLRLKNQDEMDVTVDTQLLADYENQIIRAYAPTSVLVTEGSGWL
jgi:hypothetical protein